MAAPGHLAVLQLFLAPALGIDLRSRVPTVRRSHDCTLEAGGKAYDASALSTEDLLWVGPDGYSYHLGVCGPTTSRCNGMASPASKWANGSCSNLGHLQSRTLHPLADGDDGLVIRYGNGDLCVIPAEKEGGTPVYTNRMVQFEVHCDPKGRSPRVLALEASEMACNYTVTVTSVHACPVGRSPVAIAVGGVLCFLVAAYCVCCRKSPSRSRR